MNWDEVAGKWNQFKGSLKERWGKIKGDDLTVMRGRCDLLKSKLREKYGLTRQKAEKTNDCKVPAGR